VANLERICRYMNREFSLNEEGVKILLERSVVEYLVSRYDSRSFKKPEAGDQEGYRVPRLDDPDFVSEA